MSVIKDQVVFKGRVVFNQMKLHPNSKSSDDSWPKFIGVNENSSRLSYYRCDMQEDTSVTFTCLWSLDFDKIHDFDFLSADIIVADGELSEKSLHRIALKDKSSSLLPVSEVSSKGAWKLSCLPGETEIIALYVKHTNDLHFYINFQYSFKMHSPFSGLVSQMEILDNFLIVGQLEKHLVQVFNLRVRDQKMKFLFSVEAFWGNFAVFEDKLFTSIMGSQKEIEVTNLTTQDKQLIEADIKFVPLLNLGKNHILVKERHNNTTVHLFVIPSI